MAPHRFSSLLALAVPSARRSAQNLPGIAGLDRPSRQGKSGWGAPKIHAELQKLGLTIAERTVARYLQPILHHGDSERKWLAFLQNHREVIAAMDFFTVPTVTFRVLYCFIVIEHERRKILHCNVTQHPTAEWIVQQLREAFPEPCSYQYVILDRDRKFDGQVVAFLKAAGLEAKRTSVRSPWQNGLAERWIESCRREILDLVIALNELHLRRILREYVRYHHLGSPSRFAREDAPNGRVMEQRPGPNAKVLSMARLGGLQHRYTWGQIA